MFPIKKFLILIITIAAIFSVTGCASYHRGDGVIIAEKKIADKDNKPHQATRTGAEVGGTFGSVGGAVTGFFLSLGPAAFVGVVLAHSVPVVFVVAAGGAVVGALVGGAAGAGLGAGVGYTVDTNSANAGVYEFTVKSDTQPKPFVVTQYSNPIPLNAPVQILEKDKIIYLKQK